MKTGAKNRKPVERKPRDPKPRTRNPKPNPMRIEDYALIGNFHSAGLVSHLGSIDWLCLPRFDSPACFASLLGTPENGRWLLQPKEFETSSRKYREGTLILETDFESSTGVVRLIDAMIPGAEVPTLIRLVKGLEGSVLMTMELVLQIGRAHV